MVKLVQGVGIIGSRYKITDGGKMLLEYDYWKGLLRRCYDSKLHEKYVTYRNCTCSDNFIHYEYFYEWCNKQVGFGNKGWHLDKDLLYKGNKLYSEDTCVFLPREINSLLIKRCNERGDYPIGVMWHKATNKFTSQVSVKGKQKHLGLFKNKQDAFVAYKTAKESYLKELANEWQGEIDERAYRALINYQVEITD